jgi:glycerophosphoryl diester phosphodiesterase
MVGKPLWISHRGFKENAVENTRAAFGAAVDLGFSCLETDLRLTRDNRIVLSHDPTFKRLTGDRRRVQDMTAAELADIRLDNRYPPDGRGPKTGADSPQKGHTGRQENSVAKNSRDRLLFFDEFVAEFTGCRWVFDIKPETGVETIKALSRWAEAEGMVEKIIQNTKILTWRADHEALAAAHFPGVAFYARRPECWRAGLAMLTGQPGLGAIRPGRTYALPPTFMGLSLFQATMVRRFHERDAAVVAFLPPTDALARQAMTAGFDEILTNHGIARENYAGRRD